jgi:sugar/nucleoside kinase (ribokinase family)
MVTRIKQHIHKFSHSPMDETPSVEPLSPDTSRRERYLKALEIAERHGNKFMALNIRSELRKLESDTLT